MKEHVADDERENLVLLESRGIPGGNDPTEVGAAISTEEGQTDARARRHAHVEGSGACRAEDSVIIRVHATSLRSEGDVDESPGVHGRGEGESREGEGREISENSRGRHGCAVLGLRDGFPLRLEQGFQCSGCG